MIDYKWIEGKDKEVIPIRITVGAIKERAKDFNTEYEKVRQIYDLCNIEFNEFEERALMKKFQYIKKYKDTEWKNNKDEWYFLSTIIRLTVLVKEIEGIITEASQRQKRCLTPNIHCSKPNEI